MADKKQLKKLLIFYLSLFTIGIIYAVIFRLTNFAIPCFFHSLTGLNCISCGVTRMLEAILRFEFYEAYGYNRFLFVCLPLIAFYFVKGSVIWVKHNRLAFSKTDNIVFIIFIILGVIFAVLRNIDVIL